MKIGEIEKIGERELPGIQVPTFNPSRRDEPQAPPPEPAAPPAAPAKEPEKVPA